MNCLVNNKGELLEILQESRELVEGQQIVLLEGYYDIFNVDRYGKAVWDFELNKWVGQGEQRPELLPPQPTTEERLKSTEDTLLMLMDMQMGGI